jgi:hypothetical protein
MLEISDGAADCFAKVLVQENLIANAILVVCVDLEVAASKREILHEICQDVSGDPEVAFGPGYDEGKRCEGGHALESTSKIPQIVPYGLCCQAMVYRRAIIVLRCWTWGFQPVIVDVDSQRSDVCSSSFGCLLEEVG